MRAMISALAVSMVLMSIVAGPVGATSSHHKWHRLNPDAGGEHERLECARAHGWLLCIYDKVPTVGYHYDGTIGTFRGQRATKDWTCPGWFSAEICDNVVAVFSGRARYYPEHGRPFTVREDYVVTRVNGDLVLQQYWVDMFVCPWHKTWADAVAANPNADSDCVFNPA